MKNRFFYLSWILIFFISCTSNPLEVNVSDIDFEIEHVDIVKIYGKAQSVKELESINNELNNTCGELYEYYTSEILRVGLPLQDSTANFLYRFINDSIMTIVNGKIANKFGTFNALQNEIVSAFKHLQYHIPNAMMPSKVLTYNSTFSSGVISTPNYIGLGLEMYLGPEDDVVKQVPFPVYFKEKMNVDFLLPDIAQSWLESNVLEATTEESFLANLIYYGKVLYAVKAMLPQSSDFKVLRYYEEDIKWAKENEYAVWQYIVSENLVYDRKMKTILRYFKPAPSTVGFDGSPDRIGQYIGYRIVTSYMNKNSEVTIKQLIAEKNHTKILKSYKPRQ